MTRIRSLEDVAEEIGCRPRWLADQIRAKRVPARKIGRHWRMTDADVEAALESFASKPVDVIHPRLGLTQASLKRRAS